ncbi:MAG: Bacterial SH3 domain protein [Pelotomaculum sp. PtaU1.Bin035]|nr:MAG: Bacterial SH3 domain protein [Pelotomaculum sp. PtaU1.Bin035]
MGTGDKLNNNAYEAGNPAQLAKLIDQNKETWEAGREQLYNGSILAWLQAAGYQKIVDLWSGVAGKFKNNKDAGLEAFLQLMAPDLQEPKLEVSPQKINIFGIQPGQNRDIELKITNAGRGHITGNVELSPAIPGVSVSPDIININEKYNKTISIHLTISVANELIGSTKIRISTNAGEIEVPVSYRCTFPIVMLYPWLGAVGGFLAYCYLNSSHLAGFYKIQNSYNGIPVSFVIGLVMAITIPAALIVSRRKKMYRLVIPNLIGALIAVLLLANGLLPRIGQGFLFYAIMAVAIWFILGSTSLNGMPYTAVIGSYGTNRVLMYIMRHINIPQPSEKVLLFNEYWVPAAIFAFTGYGLGQWLLDRVNFTYVRKYARRSHYAGVILMAAFIAAAAFYSLNQPVSFLPSSITIDKQVTVYTGPSTDSERIIILPAGANLKILNRQSQWYNVEFSNSGFIHKSQVRIENSKATIISDVGSNLRSAPSLQQNNILAVVPKGKTVSIIETQGDWYKVNYSDKGYAAQAQVK